MSEVYFGVLRGAHGFVRPVVLKRAIGPRDGDAERALVREARIAGALHHPNVIHVYELLDGPDGLMLAMEYLPGVSVFALLSHLRASDGSLDHAVACRIVADAARGLAHAHGARGLDGSPLGIVHRDVSPRNILVTELGVTKVLDFGIARAADDPLTRHGIVRGTLAYMSPEQARGMGAASRSDVFSLGIVLYELLTARPLFLRGTSEATLEALMRAPIPALPSGVPRVVSDLLARALVRQVERRSVTMAQIADTLEAIAAPSGASHAAVATLLEAELGPQLARRRGRVARLLAGERGRDPGIPDATGTLVLLERALDSDAIDPALSAEHPRLEDDEAAFDPTDVDPV